MQNRIIKFRAFDGVQMLRTPFFVDCEGNVYKDCDPYGVDMSGKRRIYPKQGLVLMQFIGLTDKNGMEMYHGDILKTKEDKPLVITWSDRFASFSLDKEGWAFLHWFGEAVQPEDCEVIGNIHEHPHLLTPNPQS